jgi:hypothetical protein
MLLPDRRSFIPRSRALPLLAIYAGFVLATLAVGRSI